MATAVILLTAPDQGWNDNLKRAQVKSLLYILCYISVVDCWIIWRLFQAL